MPSGGQPLPTRPDESGEYMSMSNSLRAGGTVRARRFGGRLALRRRTGTATILAATGLVCFIAASCGSSSATPVKEVSGGPAGRYAVPSGIHKIQHVIVIEQENRSFDSYFGTYPGADGIPMENGVSTVCVPVPSGGCQKPYHDTADVNGGGPHGERNARLDVNNGAMDGFIGQATRAKKGCGINVNNPECANAATPDVMGYHTAGEIPNDFARASVAYDF